MEKTYDLPRSQTKYKLFNLFPGRAYHIKVLAKNGVGWSEYSHYNVPEQSFTAVAKPERPEHPYPIDATYCSITLKIRVPYGNGSDVKSLFVQGRVITAFSRSEWSQNVIFDLSKDVIVLEPALGDECIKERTTEEIQKAIDDYNPFAARRDINYVQPAGLVLWTEDQDEIDDKKTPQDEVFEKPHGALVSVVMVDLEPNTLYEFRVAGRNSEGMGPYSIPSLRCKTKKDSAPGKARVPTLIEVKSSYVVLQIDVPPAGGGPIEHFLIDIKASDKNEIETRLFKFIDGKNEFRISGLKAESAVQFRSKAANRIGEGPSTEWTGELKLPK